MKVLVVGAVKDVAKAGAKITSLCQKQSFDAVICIGDLTGFEGTCATYHAGDGEGDDLTPVATKIKLAQGPSIARLSGARADVVLADREPSVEEVKAAAAQYVFYTADAFAEGPVYRQQIDGKRCLCRTIALAPVGNKKKSRWHYAFNLSAAEEASAESWAKALSLDKRPAESERDEHEEPARKVSAKHRCEVCGERGHMYTACPEKKAGRKGKKQAVDQSVCYFCLSNPEVAKHLIVAIGATSYVALPKGAMTPGHVLIVPVQHAATRATIADAAGYLTERTRHLAALDSLHSARGEVGVAFEISRGNGVHIHTQVIPVPAENVEQVVDGYHAAASEIDLVFEPRQPRADELDYFHVSLPDGRAWTAALTKARFDLQFGRRVIAEAMGVPRRAHWKDCVRTLDQERADTDRFRADFATVQLDR